MTKSLSTENLGLRKTNEQLRGENKSLRDELAQEQATFDARVSEATDMSRRAYESVRGELLALQKRNAFLESKMVRMGEVLRERQPGLFEDDGT